MLFDPGASGFHEFIEYFTANRSQPCPEATAWGRLCPDDYNSPEVLAAPHEYAYFALLEFSAVIGPRFRQIILTRLADSPFWATHAWSTLDLEPDEYDLLKAGAAEKYRDLMRPEIAGLGNFPRAYERAVRLTAR